MTVENSILSSTQLSDINKLKGRAESIIFMATEYSYKRTMQTEVLSYVLRIVFAMSNVIEVKRLESSAGDIEQMTHVDFKRKESNYVKNLSEFHYSAIISTEQDTQLLVAESRESVNIPVYAVFRRRHAPCRS